MAERIPYRRSLMICAGIVLCVLLFATCMDRGTKKGTTDAAALDYEQFSGSAVCGDCHKSIYESHIHTAHYLSTRPASAETVKGSFKPGKNRFAYDPSTVVLMEDRDSGFYQVGYFRGVEGISKRFDIVVGSGAKGQTYITRHQNQLYQLPVSYFTAADKWANSPQYPTHPVIFNRSITSRCLECHSTFAKKMSAANHGTEEFDSRIIYGIDCEKCHGPGAKHVAFQRQNPKETKALYIINPSAFSREQSLDLCGLCHGGRLQKTKPSFSFVSGDKLGDYFEMDTASPDPQKIDVHGNQLGLLRASKCFQMSGIVCTTCHNMHENERGKTALFSTRCMECHNGSHGVACKLTATLGPSISQNCIDCHMPVRASGTITELLPGDTKPTAAMIRSHLIAIYPDETINYKNKLHRPN